MPSSSFAAHIGAPSRTGLTLVSAPTGGHHTGVSICTDGGGCDDTPDVTVTETFMFVCVATTKTEEARRETKKSRRHGKLAHGFNVGR